MKEANDLKPSHQPLHTTEIKVIDHTLIIQSHTITNNDALGYVQKSQSNIGIQIYNITLEEAYK